MKPFLSTISHTLFRDWRQIVRTAAIALSVGTLTGPGWAQPVTKNAMLEGILHNAIQADYQELAAKCRELSASAEQLAKAPTAESLGKAQQAWLAAQQAARGVQWLQTGPIADLEYLSTFYYSKVLTNRIDEVLKSSRVIDGAYLAEFGPATRNMFALEYLLFGKKSGGGPVDSNGVTPGPSRIFGANVERHCQFVLAIAKDVQNKADKVSESWASVKTEDAAAKFAAGGQATVNGLINQMAKIIEVVAENHLNFALHLPAPLTQQLDRLEGARSGSSLPQLLAILRGTHKAFRGGDGVGLDDFLKGLNPALEARVEQQFQKCFSALEAIKPPLEVALTGRKESVQSAFEAVHALELLFKVDLASALGVTITFSSNDGD